MTTILLDSHALQWWSAEPSRLSTAAGDAIAAADELAVSAVTWFELAWLAERGRIVVTIPVRSWLTQLAAGVRTAGITPAIAHTAASLPDNFPGDPADRLIYATALEHEWQLVTKDSKMRRFPQPRSITVW
ncbi:MAG: type II toxin-antitoxin system VapC family toxin [Thermoanaerobaculia bacterium]